MAAIGQPYLRGRGEPVRFRAARNSVALWNRRAGSLCIAVCTTASTAGSTAVFTFDGGSKMPRGNWPVSTS